MSRIVNKKVKRDLKIVIVGNSGTGKTSFCTRWVKDTFTDNYKATIMSEFSYRIYEYYGNYYKIQFWDIAGQDKNVYTSKVFTKDAHGCIILCDITNQDTLEATLKWKKAIDENALFKDGGILPCVLVQNKIDLVSENELGNDEEVRQFGEKNGYINFFRTSAKTGLGVNECMDYLIKTIIERLEEYAKKNPNALVDDANRTSIVKIQQPKKDTTNMLNQSKCCGMI